ncbi:hypothetical protein BME96_06190 [Virgibacillus halodenitrificans]|uniref:Uncharacterized protein n=1 Tax=Virgibacillus halodenitrificans TaxID=1482 RepID=A0AAC9NKP3_VIRHA|nr:hypothetical protein BME96_06190 [Virgibacillus halodenitrificans]
MLAVAQIDYIRHEVNQKGETYANVGKRMGIDPRTVNKYANQEVFEKNLLAIKTIEHFLCFSSQNTTASYTH